MTDNAIAPVSSRSLWLSLAARIILGTVFVYASFDKIRYPEPFAQNIIGYDILPLAWTNIAAIWLPWLELVSGVMLILGVWVRSNALIVNFLLIVFIIALISAIVRGLDISCGCFEVGDSESQVGWMRVIEDVGLLLLSLWLMKFPNSKWALE
jgi:hypothetical protein